LSNFERRQIFDVRLAGESVTKIATLLGVLRATVSKVMSAYKNHRETKKKITAKRNIGQKSKLAESERLFRKNQNCCSTGDSRTEYSP
jgi:IS30 family transposase